MPSPSGRTQGATGRSRRWPICEGDEIPATTAKHHFMPVAMTFVLILGIPTAGGSVPPDMLPAALGALHQMLPFGQFVDLARSSACFGGHDTVRPFLTLLGWLAAAATLFAFAARRANRSAQPFRAA
ncbi:hypothetical protein ACWD01_35910 [Streptomyces sp. NPDC002835]